MRLSDGELTPEREGSVRSHLLECARCQSAHEALKAETELLRAALSQQDEALPQHIRPRGGDISWFLVATIAVGTVAISLLWTRYLRPALQGIETVGLDGTSVLTSFLIQIVLWKGWSDMLSRIIEGGLLLLVIAVAAYAAHWGWRRFRSATALLSVLVSLGAALGLAPAVAHGAVIVHDEETYRLPSDESLDNDLVVGARRVVIEGTILGDLIVAARTVEVRGEVRGDVLGFAETLDITGTVGGNVRAFAQFVEISGTVERNITAGAESIHLRPGARLGGSFTAGSQEAVLEAAVSRDLLVAAERTEIQSQLGGSALVMGRYLTIGPNASVSGAVRFYGPEEPDVSPDATLASPVEFERVEKDERRSIIERASHVLYFWAAAFLLGAAIMLVSPEATETVISRHLPSYGKSFVAGIVSAVVLPAFSIFLCVTVVGIPLALTTCFLFALGAYLAQAFVGAYIGRQILGTPASAAQSLGRLALGLALIHVAKALPFIGFVVSLAVTMWGLGAIALLVLDRLPRSGGKPAEVPV